MAALRPRRDEPPVDRGAAVRELGTRLDLVGAWCERAIADGWDSGRISHAAEHGFPFASEVGALLGWPTGRASEHVKAALARVAQLSSRAHSIDSPWSALAREMGLSELALDILAIVAAPSFCGELARVYAIVANDPARPGCDEHLLCQILGDAHSRLEIAHELLPSSPLVRRGLVVPGLGVRPFQELRVEPVVLRRLTGDSFEEDCADDVVALYGARRDLGEIALAGPLRQAIERALDAPLTGTELRLVLRGRPGSGRRTVASALAARAHRRLGTVDVAAFAREPASAGEQLRAALHATALRGWLPCVTGFDGIVTDGTAASDWLRTALRRHPGPVVLRCGLETHPPLDPGYLCFDLHALCETERASFWREALAGHGLDDAPADMLAAKYSVGAGVIESVVRQVASVAVAGDLKDQIETALRQHRQSRIDALASPVHRLASWSELVLPPDAIDSIKEFVSRVRHRRKVFEAWGFDRLMSTSRGLTALFQGPPGTGKTLVAGVIARELGADLYRIDLSRILSKWIGETERNLGAIFDAAEDGQTVLLFDEADALFARRTEVKSSTDRYANAEVNYLLQRLDSFEGIAILTTNLETSVDPAFKRRLSFRMTLPFPDEETRVNLWRAHLPPQLPTAGLLDVHALAKRFSLSGGFIRNSALRAAFLAAQEGSALTQAHLERAVRMEYREAGRLAEQGTLS